LIFLIIIVAAILRLVNLGSGDPISDEATNAFRSLGMIDFDASAAQPTPWEWLDPDLPWWARLSFHDHPLLTFYIEHWSMRIFGETDFAYRLPAAVFGLLSVYWLYLLGCRLFNERVGLLSAVTLAVTVNHVYVSRIGLQESYAIFFILLISYLFWRALDDRRYFLLLGAAVGFGLLAKYTTFIAVVICLVYAAIFRRDIFKNKSFYLAVGLAILIITPSIIYNLMLYKTFGHFDFQISHILGDYPESWRIAPGKTIGTLSDRLRTLPMNIFKTNSWVFLALAFGGIISSLSLRGRPKQSLAFLFIATISMFFLYLKIGTAYRFLAMLAPLGALWVGILLDNVALRQAQGIRLKILQIILCIFFAFEVFYSVNSQILAYPIGKMPWAYSNVRYENYNWGYNELGEFLSAEFGGRAPELSFDAKYDFLNKLKDGDIARVVAAGYPTTATLILYEGNFDFAAKLWYLDRLQVYHGWPVMSFRNYLAELGARGENYFENLGFREYYLILATNIVSSPNLNAFVAGKQFASILNKRNEEAFRVYIF